jgi:hypothetical protein
LKKSNKMPVLPLKTRSDWVFTVPLFAGLFLLNAFLVSPFIGWYDIGEMVGVTQCLGISHPSGQALFHLLGKIFLLVPFGTPAFRLGLMSAACSALASVLFWSLSCRLAFLASANLAPDLRPPTTLKVWLLLLATAWSLSLPWWRYSLTPLVYALHLLLGLLVLWALSLDKPFKWLLAFFILGAATVFRPTQFFALPFVGLGFLHEFYRQPLFPPWPVALAKDTKSSRKQFFTKIKKKGLLKNILPLAAVFILGRSTALYLPLRSALHPDIAYGDLTHLPAFMGHVLALKFSNSVGKGSVLNLFSVLQQMASHFWSDLTVIGIALVLWGSLLVWWWKERVPAFLWVAIGWGLAETLFVFTIPFPTFESHQMLLGWVYSGFLAVLPLVFLENFFRRGQYRFLKAVTFVLLLGFALLQLIPIGHLWGRKKERGAEDYARNILDIMEPNALYVPSEENEYFPVVGYQQSFGFRKDVEVIEPGIDPTRVGPRIQQCLRQNRPLYVIRKWALPPGWSYQGWGPLLKVVPASGAGIGKKAPLFKPAAAWGGIELKEVEISPQPVSQGQKIKMTYQWVRRKASPQDASDTVAGLFTDANGNYLMRDGIFWLHDIHEAPTGTMARLKPGFLYEDTRILFIPSDFPPGKYRLVVGLQKQLPARGEGHEVFNREFYERNSSQNLDKFMGRGEGGNIVQFSPATSGNFPDDLWTVTQSARPAGDPRFATVGELEILPAH